MGGVYLICCAVQKWGLCIIWLCVSWLCVGQLEGLLCESVCVCEGGGAVRNEVFTVHSS